MQIQIRAATMMVLTFAVGCRATEAPLATPRATTAVVVSTDCWPSLNDALSPIRIAVPLPPGVMHGETGLESCYVVDGIDTRGMSLWESDTTLPTNTSELSLHWTEPVQTWVLPHSVSMHSSFNPASNLARFSANPLR